MIEDKIADLIRKYRAQLLYPQYSEKPFKPDELARQIAALQPQVDGELELTDTEIEGAKLRATFKNYHWTSRNVTTSDMAIAQAQIRKCERYYKNKIRTMPNGDEMNKELISKVKEAVEARVTSEILEEMENWRYIPMATTEQENINIFLDKLILTIKSRYVKEEG